MDSVIRMAVVYLVLLVLLRFSGKRTIASIDTFDFVLLLIVSEATQQAILGSDYSLTNALLTIGTIILLNIGLSIWKQKSVAFDKYAEDVPMVLVQDGEPLQDRLDRSRVGLDEILQEARLAQGVERLDQIKWAVLERNGSISIVPKQ